MRINPLAPEFNIRPYTPDDAGALFAVRAALEPAEAGDLTAWAQQLEELLETGGQVWVVERGRRPIGYAAVIPVPGLPGVLELTGGVAPSWRGRGLGSRLLERVKTDAAAAGALELSCFAERPDDPTSLFLLRRGFYVEHEECLLEFDGLDNLPSLPLNPRLQFRDYPSREAIDLFCRLYDECFTGLPWSQPYSAAEVAAALANPEDLLFILVDDIPAGVAWLENGAGDRGRIEPIGVSPPYRGQGYGRRLLLEALRRLRLRGATLVEIGVWRDNAAALALYQSIGFRETANWYYLACRLTSGPV